MKKCLFLIVLVCQYCFAQQPNIVFLLADDLGFGEIGAYGQKEIQTPVLDSLAKAGIRFTNAYAGSPVCSPSRAVLMTGITSSKNTIRGNQGYDYKNKRLDRIPLKLTDITIAEVLKEAGYQTGFIGKWHLDHPNQLDTWAHTRGFDYAVQEQWASPYEGKRYDEQMHWINGKQDSIYFNLKDWSCKDEFRTTLAFDYLNSVDRQKPFFLFMSYRAPHGHGRVNSPNLYKDKGWPEKERKHAAKITLLDQQIGRLIHKLKTMGVLDNTIVFFTSDNGPTSEGHDVYFFNSSGSLKGHKRDTYEGGIRVPFMVNWHKKIKSNQIRDCIISGQDIMPTLAELANTKTPQKVTGTSFIPTLFSQNCIQRPYIHWEFQSLRKSKKSFRQAIRFDSIKVVRYGIENPIEVYNLNQDPYEINNRVSSYLNHIDQFKTIFKSERTESDYYPYGGLPILRK